MMRAARLAGKGDLKAMVAAAQKNSETGARTARRVASAPRQTIRHPSVLLLIQQATAGETVIKRAELMMAFSERSYFIGRLHTDISVVLGWSIDGQVARIDQMYLLPGDGMIPLVTAVLREIESSAEAHIGKSWRRSSLVKAERGAASLLQRRRVL
ncbi:MAG: hypothetical protein M5U34_48830 [Chloroflexi bacterium]|nr:hypothetical protein [Chloroflexota bacterium]